MIYFTNIQSGNRSRSIDDSLKKYNNLSMKQDKDNFVRHLINPFNKSRYHVKVTSNRRRWSHIFPESNQLHCEKILELKTIIKIINIIFMT